MLQGETVKGGWKSEEVKEALDLCLACKGCKGDCPVQVDMATYKAEFLAHYYKGRLRPRQAYVFGLIHLWARLASHAPWLANFFTQTPVLKSISKSLAGIAPQRELPKFAPYTFKEWFRKRKRLQHSNTPTLQRSVILWPDTFNDHFHPETARAALEVLEKAGSEVIVPVQDILNLGSEARMNRPGAEHDNWSWRVAAGALTVEHAEELRELGEVSGRS